MNADVIVLGNTLYFLTLLLLGVMVAAMSVSSGPKKHSQMAFVAIVFLVNFVLRGYLLWLNEGLKIFDPKFAGEISLDIYNIYLNGIPGAINNTFVPQMLLNFLGFSMFAGNRVTIEITNSFYVALSGVIAYAYMYRLYGSKAAVYSMIGCYAYLGALNFSIFGLRDPILFFFSFLYILSFIFLIKCPKTALWVFNLAIFLGSAVMILWSRPELLPTIGFFPGIYFLSLIFIRINRIRRFSMRFISSALVIAVFASVFLLAGVYAYRIVLAQIGITTLVSPLEIAGTYADNRYERQFLDQGGSNGGGGAILPPGLYRALPPVFRVPVQTLGIIVLPFPWLINDVPKLLAFLDSIYVIIILYFTLRWLRKNKTNAYPEARLLLWTFMWGIVIMGTIVNNTGNAFRLRLSVLPYLIIAFAIASLVVSKVRQDNHANRASIGASGD
jgi:hypothetical protein